MHKVSKSEKEHHITIEVSHIVAKHILEMCKEMEDESNTIAGEQRYGGLANEIERQLEEDMQEYWDQWTPE